jgi:hypothetical protein
MLATVNVSDLSATLVEQGNGDGKPPHLVIDIQTGVKCPGGVVRTQSNT